MGKTQEECLARTGAGEKPGETGALTEAIQAIGLWERRAPSLSRSPVGHISSGPDRHLAANPVLAHRERDAIGERRSSSASSVGKIRETVDVLGGEPVSVSMT
jgi:hypothetical protein